MKLMMLAILFSWQSAQVLLQRLAATSPDLSPIVRMADSYRRAGMTDELPLYCPVLRCRRISDGYGWRIDPFTHRRRFHRGIDFAANLATEVYAAGSGTVTHAGRLGGYGLCVIVRHRYGFSTLYGHLSYVYVHEGQSVRRGKVVGFVGSTGRSTGHHLHYEVRKNGRAVRPMFDFAAAN